MSHVSTAKGGVRCPTCGNGGKPVLFGLPDPSAIEASAQGELILAGCVLPEDHPHWGCPEGHLWSGDEREWDGALRAAIRDRPHCRLCGGATRYLIYPGAEELFLDELARGEAELAAEPGSATTAFGRICRSCRTVS